MIAETPSTTPEVKPQALLSPLVSKDQKILHARPDYPFHIRLSDLGERSAEQSYAQSLSFGRGP
jgi:hypothetical protein